MKFPDIQILNKVRSRVGRFMLNRALRNNNRQVNSISLKRARKIGVLFSANDERTFDNIRYFIRSLKEGNKFVYTLGYVTKMEVLEFLKADTEFTFISPQDFNWYYKPNHHNIDEFTEQGFDVLLDIRMKKTMPLNYIVALSKARLKVGRYDKENKDLYDFMIELDDQKSQKFLMNQIKYYLGNLNEKEESPEISKA